jgi:hypothetical protein
VDTVLSLRANGACLPDSAAVKNRFGSTNEIGVFEMKDTGLEEIKILPPCSCRAAFERFRIGGGAQPGGPGLF